MCDTVTIASPYDVKDGVKETKTKEEIPHRLCGEGVAAHSVHLEEMTEQDIDQLTSYIQGRIGSRNEGERKEYAYVRTYVHTWS